MVNIIVVDDEQVITDGLSQYIEKNIDGYKVVGCFSDGNDAVKYLENNKVDVIITDIEMIGVSGLKLAEIVFNNYPDIFVIILSGYNNFEYAQQAVKFGVKRYLTKPVNLKELKDVLNELSDEINRKHDITSQNSINAQRAFLDFIKNSFYYINSIEDNSEVLSKKIGDCYFCLFSVLIDNINPENNQKWKYGADAFYSAIFNLFNMQNTNMKFYNLYNRDKRMYIVSYSTCFESEEEMKKATEKEILYVAEQIYKLFSISAKVEIETLSPDIENSNFDYSGKKLEALVEQAKTFVDNNFRDNISLSDTADALNVSPAYLSRIFKQISGENFTDYLLTVRMNMAVELLKSGKYKIYEISELVGYSNSKYFNNVFRVNMGLSPKQYYRTILMGGDTDEGHGVTEKN